MHHRMLQRFRGIALQHANQHTRCSIVSTSSKRLRTSKFLTSDALNNHSPEHVVVPSPLSNRPACHEIIVEDIISWRKHQSSVIASIGDGFVQADGGPTASELLRELDWVLDDAIAAYSTTSVQFNGQDDVSCQPTDKTTTHSATTNLWQPIQWKQLSTELDYATRNHKDTSQWRVLCRASTEELYTLWHQRLHLRAPFQYLINTAHWHKFILSVGPGILVPRPETEIFADVTTEAITNNPSLASSPWLDLGTGSGAIAIAAADALKQHHPTPHVWAVDYSPTAVAYARYNAHLTNLHHHITVLQGSWYEPVQHLKGKLAAVLSNPPYIPQAQMPGLQAEVGHHEPWSALSGGDAAGLESLRVICAGAVDMLLPGGLIALETAGNEQAYAVAELLGAEFEGVCVKEDCYGVPRIVIGYRRAA